MMAARSFLFNSPKMTLVQFATQGPWESYRWDQTEMHSCFAARWVTGCRYVHMPLYVIQRMVRNECHLCVDC